MCIGNRRERISAHVLVCLAAMVVGAIPSMALEGAGVGKAMEENTNHRGDRTAQAADIRAERINELDLSPAPRQIKALPGRFVFGQGLSVFCRKPATSRQKHTVSILVAGLGAVADSKPIPVEGRTFLSNGSKIVWQVPPGIRVDFAGEGEWKTTLDVFRDLGLAFGAALFTRETLER